MIIRPPIRGQDNHGAGFYHASRGDRLHNGVDLSCPAGSELLCPIHGKITKLGYPYADHMEYRYIQVTMDDLDHRFFYVQPNPDLALGDIVRPMDVLGVVQDLTLIYEGITNHVHYEIKQGGDHINPMEFL